MEPCTKLIPLQVFPLTTFDKVWVKQTERRGVSFKDFEYTSSSTPSTSIATSARSGVEEEFERAQTSSSCSGSRIPARDTTKTTPGLEEWEIHLGVQRTSSTREQGGIDTVVESTTQV